VKKKILVSILAIALALGATSGVIIYAQDTGHPTTYGNKIVGTAMYGAFLERAPEHFYDANVIINNPDCRYEKTITEYSIMAMNGSVVFHAIPEGEDAILAPHESVGFPIHWLLIDSFPIDEYPYEPFTVEAFWEGRGLPLEGVIKEFVMAGEWPEEGEISSLSFVSMSDHAMTNMNQKH